MMVVGKEVRTLPVVGEFDAVKSELGEKRSNLLEVVDGSDAGIGDSFGLGREVRGLG